VLVPAAVFHDIGRSSAAPHGDGEHHESEGAAIALAELERVGLPRAICQEVAETVARHHDRAAMDTATRAPLYDADLIVNLREGGEADWEAVLQEKALTDEGRRIGSVALSR